MTLRQPSGFFRATRALLVVGLLGAGCASTPFPPVTSRDGGRATTDAGADAGALPSDAGLPLAGVCDVLIERRCGYLKRCGLISSAAESLNDCKRYFGATWCNPAGWPAYATAEIGTMHYEPLRGEACALAFTTRACRDWDSEPESCQRMVNGNVDLRQRCYGVPGLNECLDGVCRGTSCPRTCQPLGLVGDVCLRSGDCRPPLFCRPTVGSPTTGECRLAALASQFCAFDTDCAEGLVCLLSACRAPPGPGSPCLSERCDDSSYCAPSADGGVCVQRADAGSPCAVDRQCQQALVCTTARGVCAPAELTAAGAACAAPQRCPAGTTCSAPADGGTDGTCEPERPAQAPCVSSADCAPHLACVTTDGGLLCGERRGADAGCSDDRDCQLLHRCVAQRCVPQPKLGEACTDELPCRWGACSDVDGGRRCVEPRAPGAPCQTGADCASGECASGRCNAACTP